MAALLVGTLAFQQRDDDAKITGDKQLEEYASTMDVALIVNLNNEGKGKDRLAFVLSFAVKDSFDQFIFEQQQHADLGQLLAIEVIDAFQRYASKTYTPESAVFAIDLFSRYVNYKVALSSEDIEVDLSMQSLSDVAFRLDERELLRRRFFNDREYHFLFSQDAETDNAALQRLKIAQEKTLDEAQRKALIMEQINNGSQSEKRAFRGTLDMHKIQQIKHDYVDSNTRYNAIAAEFGHEVAERFLKTWEGQKAWGQRVDKYKAYRKSLADGRMSDEEVAQALRQYETSHFNSNEIKRLRVLTQPPTS
ncbi:lipase chaperone [Alteromonas gracilis]|uniref:lipase chaperone n=1 Tax=Alteromonas gracilis TaxID=1479524 RepID=UPI00321B8D61